jgi:2',3'-cyclic-nucleotide 2'-phosphodiesterase (5'-nucleotidase family)
MDSRLQHVCGYSEVDLDGRFELLRSQETNVSNFVADILFTEFPDTDIAFVNSGTLRSNSIIPKGAITLKQMC